MSDYRSFPASILAGLFLLFCFAFGSPAAADQFAGNDKKLEALPAAQKALAQRMNAFAAEMDERYFGRSSELNGGEQTSEQEDFETDTADYNIKVERGPVVEKIGRMLSYGKKNQRGDEELLWGRFYSIDVHPKTPLVGMLHATAVIQMYPDNKTTVGGWLGILPGTRVEEDLGELKQLMDDVFAKYGVDVEFYRNLICDGDPMEIRREFRRRPACVGASFYARPPFPDPDKNFDFVSEAFVKFTDLYMETIERRKDQSFTEKDIVAQDQMRKRWLIDQLFSDPYASSVVPFEVWSMANVPPVIKF